MTTEEKQKTDEIKSVKLEELDDQELLQFSVNRNYQAFEELVKRYEGRIYRLGLKMLRSPQDAEDLLQKTFLSVFENMHRFKGMSKVSTWIFRIATNHALMKLRSEKAKPVHSLDAPVETGNDPVYPQLIDENSQITDFLETREFFEKVEEAVAQMPYIYRLVFILRDIEGFSNTDVAQMLNLTVPAVKSRVLRARLFLRERLLQDFKKEESHERQK